MGHHERPDNPGTTTAGVLYMLAEVVTRIEKLEFRMAWTQNDVDAITTELHDGLGRIQDEITNLENAQASGQPLDLTNLKAEADAVAAVVPAPAPAPAPTDGGDGSAPVVDPGSGDGSAPVVDPGTGDGGSSDPTAAPGDGSATPSL